MISCGSSRRVTYPTKRDSKVYSPPVSQTNTNNPTITDKIIWTAVTYKGTPYKYAGTTKRGMDCSGLVYTSFKARGVNLPRTSALMYARGYKISLRQVRRGDLVFFKTSRRGRAAVNHVGLVTSSKKGVIKFIHSSSSRGVIVSSLKERYWNRVFVAAKRVL